MKPRHLALPEDLMADGSPKTTNFSLKQLIGRNGSVMMSSVERLLKSTSINAKDGDTGQSLIEHACRSGDIALAKFCSRHGAALTALTPTGESCLNLAADRGSYEMMAFLVSAGVSVNMGDSKGRSALHMSVWRDDADGVCRLLELGAYVNIKDKEGRTPLMYAAIKGHRKTAELLLELGANLNAVDNANFSAASHAEANDHFSLMDRFIQLGGRSGSSEAGLVPMKGGLDPLTERTLKGVQLGMLSIKPVFLKKTSSLGRLGKFRLV